MTKSFFSAIGNIDQKYLFLTTEPEILDFTSKENNFKLIIYDKNQELIIPFLGKPSEFIGTITSIIKPDTILIGWNLKSLFSYILYKTKKEINICDNIYDLKILEWFLGIEKTVPKSFDEAKKRLFEIINNKSWNGLHSKIYKSIYLKLIKNVIPSIENAGMVDQRTRKLVHCCYEIAGQLNGRMKCLEVFDNCFNPHSLDAEDRKNLKPPSHEELILYYDFKHMEVSVLQWLSGDEVLGEILNTNEDVYEKIWEIITNIKCTPEFRKKCKSMFLPVIFGEGVQSFSESKKVSISVAEKLINSINHNFSKAINWVKSRENFISEDGIAIDVFGRQRKIDEKYKVKNFCIQSPASLICLYKLVKLHSNLPEYSKIGLHIHDGYALFANKEHKHKINKIAKEILESEEELCKGLKLKVDCKEGKNL